jgi:hypothetical protein
MRFIMFNFVVIGALVYLVGEFPGDDIQSANPVQQTQAEPAPVSIDLIAASQQDRQVENAAVDALVTSPEATPTPDLVPDVTREISEMAALPADMVVAETQEPNFGATAETSAIEPPPLESPTPPEATDELPELEEVVNIAPVVLPPEPVLFAPAVADAQPVLAEGATFMTPLERRRELDNLILDMEGVFLDSLRN